MPTIDSVNRVTRPGVISVSPVIGPPSQSSSTRTTSKVAEVQFFERATLKGSQKFSCCLSLFQAKPGMSAESQIAAALSKDKYGLAISSLAAPSLKPVALSRSDDTTPVLATKETITAATYPLARTVYIYANRKPKAPVPANVAAFLKSL